MATGEITDPYVNFNFLVEIGGITRAAFQECSGFDSTVKVIEHREGGDNLTTRKLPGMNEFSNITLMRGITDDRELYDWHRSVLDGEITRQNGSIVLLNRKGNEVKRWNFDRAWPTKYDGPDLKADGNEVAIETLELAHEGIKLA